MYVTEAFAWFKGEQRATAEAVRLRTELSDALAEVARHQKLADTVTADMARLQMEVQRSEDRHSAASPMVSLNSIDPSTSPNGETLEELSRNHAHAEALWLKEKKELNAELSALREERELAKAHEELLRDQLKKELSSEVDHLESQLRAAREASQTSNVHTVEELNRLLSNHDIALAELENLRAELKLAQEEAAWLRADKNIAEEGAKVKAKIKAAAEAARQKELHELKEEKARLEEELEELRAEVQEQNHTGHPDDDHLRSHQREAPQNVPTFKDMYESAVKLQAKGKLTEAVPLCSAALTNMRETLGDDHTNTLLCMNTLATLLYGLGDYSTAEPLAEESYHGLRSKLGEKHKHTLTALVNLGMLLQALKQLDQAEALFREFFELREGILPDENHDTVRAMNSLSLLLQSQGKVAEAEPYCRRSLECMRETLGQLHPDTLQSISNLAMLLYGQGKLEAAEPYCYEALSGMRTTLGNTHMSTLASVSNLAMMLQAQKKLEAADPYCREALAGMRNTLGNTHSITLASVSNLAMLLYNRGQLEESEELYREAFETMRDSLGDDNSSTLGAMSNLAMLLQSRGSLDDAAVLFRDCLARRQRVLGDTHPDTIRSLNSLACLLQSQGKINEAEEIYRETFVLVQQRAEASAAEEVERYKERLSESSQSVRSDDLNNHGISREDSGMYANYDEEGLILKGTLSSSTLSSLNSEGDINEGTAVLTNLHSRRTTPVEISNAVGDMQSVLSSTSSTARLMMLASQSPKPVSQKKPAPPMQLIKCAHEKCRKKFTSLDRYITHLRDEHKDSKDVVDELVGRVTSVPTNSSTEKPHQQVSMALNPYAEKSEENIYFGCKYENCSHLFKSIIDRNAHERETHSNNHNCNASISSISSNSTGTGTSPLPIHDFMADVSANPLPCPDKSCKKTFKSSKDRNNHMKDAHGLVMRSGVLTPPPGLALFSSPVREGINDVVFQGTTNEKGSSLNTSGDSKQSSSQGRSRLALCPFAGCSKQCKSDAGLIDHIRKAHSAQVQNKQKTHRSGDTNKSSYSSYKTSNR